VHRRLSDRRDRRAVRARRAPLHLVSHDRASGSIPEALRPLIGNRVYGCDDCQLHCPWNRFAQDTGEDDFAVRNGLDAADLVTLFAWTEAEFRSRLEGSAIRRIGYERWLRNLAVGLGNAPSRPDIIAALEARADDPSALVREHVAWALARTSRSRNADAHDARGGVMQEPARRRHRAE
jgi:epoxyqueuosine reductase